jgi:energy-converting hydrogenase Eha subunit A
MNILIIVLVIIGALISIVSGIWVAFALGSAISRDKKKDQPT